MFDDTQTSYLRPKLSDFASSFTWDEGKISGGTPYWNAPECCDGSIVTTRHRKSPLRDRYSLGLVFWNVFSNELPFRGLPRENITRAKEEGYLLKRLQNLRDTRDYVCISLSICESFLINRTYQQAAFMFHGIDIAEQADNDDAILSIIEVMEYLLQPNPEDRAPRNEEHISRKLRHMFLPCDLTPTDH